MMSKRSFTCLFFGVSMLAAIALVGCSSSKDDGPAMMPGDGPAMMPGDGTGMAETPAVENSLSMLLPDPSNQFVPAAAVVLKRIFGATPSSELTDEFRVESIRSDGANGFHVTYAIGGGAPATIHFEADDLDSNGNPYYLATGTGEGNFWFWSSLGSFNGPEKNRGPAEVKYLDAYGISNFRAADDLSYRGYVTAGIETEADNLPTGTASYYGRAYADTYEKDNPTTRLRTRMHGRLELTADFDGSTVDGLISNIQQTSPGSGRYASLPDTTDFAIENGQIVGGRFTAELKGRDTNASAPLDETVLGYEGTASGVFFGPAAEEAGGTLSASSTAHGRVLTGWFAGKQPNVPEVDQPVLSSIARLDLPGSTSELTDTAEVTSLVDDGAGGFRMTYMVDGVEEVIHLEASSHGSVDDFETSYHKRIGNRSYWLWHPGTYSGVLGFNYFDVKATAVTDWPDAGYDYGATDSRRGFAVYGTPTEVADLPTGTATYVGSAYADIHSATDPRGSARASARGRLTLNADFGASTISGAIDQMTTRRPGQSNYEDITTEVTIENGMISDSQFSADLTSTGYTGDMTGHFYGPAAEEVGGVWQGTNSVRNTVVQGYFGGRKQ